LDSLFGEVGEEFFSLGLAFKSSLTGDLKYFYFLEVVWRFFIDDLESDAGDHPFKPLLLMLLWLLLILDWFRFRLFELLDLLLRYFDVLLRDFKLNNQYIRIQFRFQNEPN
jgi:hypothetical protein